MSPVFPRYDRSKPELLTGRVNCVKELDVIAVIYGYYTTANNQLIALYN